MADEKQPAEPTIQAQPATAATKVHDSNPFTTAWTGIQRLFSLNLGALVGVTLFTILLGVLAALSVATMVLAGIAAMLRFGTNVDASAMGYGEFGNFSESLSVPGIYATLILGFAMLLLFVTLMQSMQLKLTAATAEDQSINFGDVLKKSLARSLPLMGLAAVMLAVALASILLLVVLGKVLGFITIVLGLILLIGAFYIMLRVMFAGYSIVEEGMGPIASLKRSWSLSEGHVIEAVGAAAVSCLIIIVPDIIISALAKATEDAEGLSATLSIIGGVVMLVLSVVSTMAIAQRFAQLKAIAAKQITPTRTHASNYLAIVLIILALPLFAATSPRQDTTDSWYNDSTSPLYEGQQTDPQIDVEQFYPEDTTTPTDNQYELY